MTDRPVLRAPWTSEQVDALNRFQAEGGMHPFTCGRDHETHRTLDATHAGWICPDSACDYTQDWAHPFMAQPDAWPKPLRFAASTEVEPSDPTQCSGEEGFCPEHGFHRHSLKQSAPRGLRDRYASAMWAAAEQAIAAEWICCEPLKKGHDLCAQGYHALRMISCLIVDSPEHYKPAPLTDAVLAIRDDELEASQRRAIRIQQLLDDTRDRMRKLAAELANGTHWDGNEPEIGERIVAALHQPKETP